MKGIIKKVESVTREIKNGDRKGEKFSQIILTVDVKVGDTNDIKTLKASMSTEYAVKYFGYCGYKSKDLYGLEVNCVLAKRRYEREDGTEGVYNYIKFVNCLDEEGNSIIMPNEKDEELPF